jgi:hypothetical protein
MSSFAHRPTTIWVVYEDCRLSYHLHPLLFTYWWCHLCVEVAMPMLFPRASPCHRAHIMGKACYELLGIWHTVSFSGFSGKWDIINELRKLI